MVKHLIIAVVLLFSSACATLPEPPVRDIINKKMSLLENFDITIDDSSTVFEKIKEYKAPEYPKLKEGTDPCLQEAQTVFKVSLEQIETVKVFTKEGEIKELLIADNESLYYKTGDGKDFYRLPNENEYGDFAIITESDVTACHEGIELKRLYAKLIPLLIKEVQSRVELGNKRIHKEKVLHAYLEKEKALEILKREITIEILSTDVKYANELIAYQEKLMNLNSWIFKIGSFLSLIIIGASSL